MTMSVTVTAQTRQPYRQIIQSGNHTFFSDTSQKNGGQDTAPDPHAFLLGAWGACTTMTLQMYAQRKGWQLDEVNVSLQELPRANGKWVIEKNIQVKGNLTPAQIADLQRIAGHCPVNRLIMEPKEIIGGQVNLIS